MAQAEQVPMVPKTASGAQGSEWFAKVRVTLRALQHRNFQLFLGGQFLSLIGTWVQTVAQSWLVYKMTGSSVMLGLVTFAGQIPYLFSPIGGVLADRMNKHRLIILTQVLSTLQAVLLAWLTLSGAVQVWHVIVLALVLGVIGVFDMTGRQAFLVEMVGKEDLMNAIALNSSVYNSGRILGPAVAGVMVAAIGEGWCFAVNAVSFLAVIAGLLMMRLQRPHKHSRAESPIEQFRQGLEYIRTHQPTRALLLNLCAVSIMNYPFIVLMPIFADRIFHGGAQTLGILMSAFGVGAVLGALYMASRTALSGTSRRIVRSTIVYSIALIGFSFSWSVPIACFFLIVAGAGMLMQVASTNTGLQSLAPDAMRGRVMGFYGMMFLGMVPIGSLIAGWLGDRIGAPWTVSLGAVGCIIAAAAFNRRRVVVASALRQLMQSQAGMVAVPTAVPEVEAESS